MYIRTLTKTKNYNKGKQDSGYSDCMYIKDKEHKIKLFYKNRPHIAMYLIKCPLWNGEKGRGLLQVRSAKGRVDYYNNTYLPYIHGLQGIIQCSNTEVNCFQALGLGLLKHPINLSRKSFYFDLYIPKIIPNKNYHSTTNLQLLISYNDHNIQLYSLLI